MRGLWIYLVTLSLILLPVAEALAGPVSGSPS